MLTGKVLLITGAAAETAALVIEAGGKAESCGADVTDEDSVKAMVGAALKAFGRLDCGFNNAGIEGAPDAAATLSEAEFDRVIAVNLKGVWLSMKHELDVMLRQGSGAIVNTASIAGLIGTPGYAAYVASKHGVTGLTKGAALAYAANGIRVNAVCPGFIETAMTGRIFEGQAARKDGLMTRIAQGRFGTPEEIADTVVWMLSDGARYMNGHMLAVDGGYVAM